MAEKKTCPVCGVEVEPMCAHHSPAEWEAVLKSGKKKAKDKEE